MANISENLLVKGARGNVGKQFVYKTEDDKTHIVKMPKVTPREPNQNETKVRDLFAAATRYGRGALASAELGAAYIKKAGSKKKALGIAVKDYLTAPKVSLINSLNYNGTPNSVIAVTASDDFKVTGVQVSIQSAAGVVIEQGAAVQETINTNLWKYTALQTNSTLAGSVIKAVATDVPGNEGSLQVTL